MNEGMDGLAATAGNHTAAFQETAWQLQRTTWQWAGILVSSCSFETDPVLGARDTADDKTVHASWGRAEEMANQSSF